MIIEKLYRKTRTVLEEFALGNSPWEHMSSIESNNTKYIVKIQNEDLTYFLDLGHMFLETPISRFETWDTFRDTLTDIELEAYRIHMPDLDSPKKVLRTVSPLSSNDFLIEYTDKDIPDRRDVKTFIDHLPDLVITKTGNDCPIKLENSLLSVNGLVSRPIIRPNEKTGKREYFVPEGMNFLRCTTHTTHPNLLLMDFELLGGMEIVPLSECKLRYHNQNNEPCPDVFLTITLPDGKDLHGKTACIVMAHSLFLPNSVKVKSENSLLINLAQLRIRMSLAKSAYAKDNYKHNTHLIETPISEETYVKEHLSSKDHYGAFLVLINSEDLWIDTKYGVSFAGNVKFTQYPDYIPHDLTSQSFMDYTQIEYLSRNAVYSYPTMTNLDVYTEEKTQLQLYPDKLKCRHVDCVKDYKDNQFVFLKIMSL
jgi:hypothetical protein